MSVDVRPVQSRRDRRRFLDLPYRLYATEPRWVPPLRIERKQHLDPAKNPFFEHAEVQFFLAERDGRVVGRISAHVDHALNAFQDNRWGLFGFFECEDDPEVARALIAAADGWLRDRGRDRMVGPMDYTTNDECGLLIEGHERPPIILCPWQHPYYQRLLEQDVGLDKAMDLLMWELRIEGREHVHQSIWDMADAVEPEHGIVVRSMRKKDLEAEVGRFLEVYNSAWERNWGFVPLNEREVRHYAKQLKPVLDEHWAYIAERKDNGEVVGAALTLPDINQVLAHVHDGRLLPFGWLQAVRYRKDVDRVRVFALGVKPQYQHTGVAARMYQMHFDAAASTPQSWGEMGWILETNTAMNRAMEGMGGKVVRRYRVYERVFESSSAGSIGEMSGSREHVPGIATGEPGEPVEVLDAEIVVRDAGAAAVVPATAAQAAIVAAGGFAVGAATVAVMRRHRSRKAARRSRNAIGQIVGSRRFLVDVHLLRDS